MTVAEYPLAYNAQNEVGNIPYYPVNSPESNTQYGLYAAAAQKYKNLFLCGRLAEFRYYNMDVCIEHALAYFDDISCFLKNKQN